MKVPSLNMDDLTIIKELGGIVKYLPEVGFVDIKYNEVVDRITVENDGKVLGVFTRQAIWENREDGSNG